ncbi:MAG: 50S ribosomal protein L16 [Candidatus ainarchaeum sp.]|nr:50S ribosomal protein L16 [Candidatus ainarchaeum sp.]MDD3975932.1 50S ribosomal protein L16 [Candidatus ainarchaeum sp.]
MGLRPGHCYCKKVKKRAYTRFAKKVHKKNFVGGVPGLKIRQFHMGFGDREYTHVVHYVTKEKIQIRDNALEAVRITIVRQLNKKLTQQNYYMKLRVTPQFFLRENKQAQGAHADRIQQGMSQCPFGKVIGRSSRVRPNQKIFSILCDEEYLQIVKDLLSKVGSKFPCSMRIVAEKNTENIKSVGTTKKRRKLLAIAEQEAKEADEKKQKAKDAKKNVKGAVNTKDTKSAAKK